MGIWDRIEGAKGRAAAALLAVFIAGGGAGYFAGRWHTLRRVTADPLAFGLAPRKSERKVRFMHRLQRDLSLREAQRARVDDILRRRHEEMMRFRKEIRPNIERTLQEATSEIRSLLDSGQQSKFDVMVTEYRERRRRLRERWMQRRREMMRRVREGERGGPGGR
ncbi:MAG: hypothetical protein V3V62_08765 [bacterium]